MDAWSSYSLSDFLLFSPRVYFRMFELHNQALWPVHLVTLGLGVLILGLLVRRTALGGRVVLGVLGFLWMWLAWVFFWERFATINWAARYVTPVFAFEGLLLLGLAAFGRGPALSARAGAARNIALAVFAMALVGYPVLASALGRPWQAAEVFGIVPDPTAIATLAALAFMRGAWLWLAMVVPVLWCFFTGLTLWALNAPEFFVAPLCAGVVFVCSIWAVISETERAR